MLFEFKIVDLKAIELDNNYYCITTEKNRKDLISSVSELGLLNPPILLFKNFKYIVISGFRRISSCIDIGHSDIMTKVLKPDISDTTIAKIAVSENSLQRDLNLIEQSRSFDLLFKSYKSIENVAKIASSLKLSQNFNFIKKVIKICRFPENIQQSILNNTISFSMAQQLEKIDPDAKLFFTLLFNNLKLSLNKQKEIINLTQEISYRDEIPLIDVLQDKNIILLLNDEKFDSNVKVKKIRSYFRKLRYPEITKAERKFKCSLKQLNLNKDITLSPPKDFETGKYSFKIDFSNLLTLKNRLDDLMSLTNSPVFNNILNQ